MAQERGTPGARTPEVSWRWRSGGGFVAIAVIGLGLAGCTVVGPTAIRSGRLAYNEAIAETNNQQMLMVAVANRYQERTSLLSVSSVTANVSFLARTGVQLGFGDEDNYTGNLVPFTGGTVYEENPTISYTPVAGEEYVRQLMSPLPVAVLAQFSATLVDPTPVFFALVSSVNGVKNPDFLFTSTEPDPRFGRFVAIITELTQANRLHWFADPEQADRFSIVIDHYAPDYVRQVDELLDVLGLPARENSTTAVTLPILLALDARAVGGIGVMTRSVYRLADILSASIDVPEEHEQLGVTSKYPPLGAVGRGLRVRYAERKPEHASVSVRYRDGWFYIDDTDQTTKEYFRTVAALWAVTIAQSTQTAARPVLTVPVSR